MEVFTFQTGKVPKSYRQRRPPTSSTKEKRSRQICKRKKSEPPFQRIGEKEGERNKGGDGITERACKTESQRRTDMLNKPYER